MSTGSSGVQITCARISNFRSLKNVEIALDKLTILVGANNAGKTSLLDALQAAIGAGRRTLGKEDIHLELDETDVPKDRKAIIDILIWPVDEEGEFIDSFPSGSFWTGLWGVGISQDDDYREFVAIRTCLQWDSIHGDYRVTRKFLKEWKPFSDWLNAEEKSGVIPNQIEPIALHYIDAKRDLDEDLRSRTSFWRKLTDDLGLTEADIKAFEDALSILNQNIIEKSEVLKHLRENLAEIQRVVAAEKAGIDIAPVARRLRDLSKGVDVSLSTAGSQAFPLTRHGMGTRSLASLLVFRAFASWRHELAKKGGDLVHTLLALEEPEAHLHPQAQRALIAQIRAIPGQRIVSTHSPYFVSQSKLEEIRLIRRESGVTKVAELDLSKLTLDDRRKLEREVVASRGDILFARALILFEGPTEEQALPLMAQVKWQASVHELGFSFVPVGGANYFPFVWLAQNLQIPWYIFSDGEAKTISKVTNQLTRAGVADVAKCPNVVIIPGGNDYEGQLIAEGYLDAIETGISSVDGADALDTYIRNLNGQLGKSRDGVQGVRNYTGSTGRAAAALDFLREEKVRLAAPVAQAICELPDPARRVPKCLDKFFSVLSADFGLS